VLLAREGTRKRNLCAQNLGHDVVRDLLRRQPDTLHHLAAGPVVEELHRQANFVQGGVNPGGPHFLPDA
jgi:hypothetical protein